MCTMNNMEHQSCVSTEYSLHNTCNHYFWGNNRCPKGCEDKMMFKVDTDLFGYVEVFNLSRYLLKLYNSEYAVKLDITQVLQSFPEFFRRAGRIVTFINPADYWETWLYIGKDNSNWSDIDYWDCLHTTGGGSVNWSDLEAITDEEIDTITQIET